MSIRANAKNSLLPLISANEAGAVVEAIYCTSISGGNDFREDMPRSLTLCRETKDGKVFNATYELRIDVEKVVREKTGDIISRFKKAVSAFKENK